MGSATSKPAVPAPRYFLTCVTGPDQGKRLAITEDRLVLGRGSDCNLLSDDPEVTEHYASLALQSDGLHIRALSKKSQPFIDGHPKAELVLSAGQQVRMGRSLWELSGPRGGEGVLGFLTGLGDRLSSIAGLEKTRDWNLKEMFSEVVKRHADEEVEAYFTVGTSETTPGLEKIDAHWPKPWVFLRVLLASVALYAGFVWAWKEFDNLKLVPAVIMTGAVAIPFALLIFFFEVNVPRNISLYQVIKLLLFGGLLSIASSLMGFKVTGLSSWLGAASAGIIEETGKDLALLLVVRRARYRWTLNGLLLGATIGTGFAVFESAGYALQVGLGEGAQAMRANIMERGILSLFGGHVLWTALAGAALWRLKGNQPFRREMFFDPRFLRVVGLCMLMHMFWNAPITLPFYGKYLVVGAASWLLVLGFIQAGIKEVGTAQATG